MIGDEQRLSAARVHFTDCHLCPHHCGSARLSGHGVCRVGDVSYVASEMLHMGEEKLLRPAHAIFLSGCTARCRFCIASRYAFHANYGVPVTASELAHRIVLRQDEGARSICFIGGDPVPHIPLILETLDYLGEHKRVPAVFNSNFFVTSTAIDLLDGVIDIYLPDLKFGPGACGDTIGTMPNYWQVVTGAIERLVTEGKRVIVRHLLMPGHLHCCTEPVLAWLAERPRVEVSLLNQYQPPARSSGEWAKTVPARESAAAHELAHRLRLHLVD
jgi:putative pyruvate formate lyase activating enzyme